jgi:methyl-accepting chemotaxis protein
MRQLEPISQSRAGVWLIWFVSRFELKIAASYLIAALILIASLIAFGVRQADAQDRAADDSVRHAVEAALGAREKNFQSWVNGYAVWDEMYKHMALSRDAVWAAGNIGSEVWKTFVTPMSGVFILNENGAITYHYWAYGKQPSLRPLAPDIARLRAQADRTNAPAVARIVSGSHPYFLGVARIRPSTTALSALPATAHYLVLFQPVDPLLEDAANSLSIKGLKLTPRGGRSEDRSAGMEWSRATIAWTPPRPGTAMLLSARWPMIGLVVIAGFVGVAQFFMARRLGRMLDTQREQAAFELRKSLAAQQLASAAEEEAHSLMTRLQERDTAVRLLSEEREAERERQKERARAQSLETLAHFEHDFDTVLQPISEIASVLGVQSEDLRQKALAGRSAARTVTTAARESLAAIESVVEGNRELDAATLGLDSEINRTVSSIQNVEWTIDGLIVRLNELGASSVAVDEIVSSVAVVARRINMLAVNARIEAAHAGAAGVGFAVVADEVKQLAVLTRDATKSITDVLRTMQTNTETGKAGVEEIRPIIREVVDLTSLSRSALDRQTQIATGIIGAISKARSHASDTDVAMQNLDQVIGSSEKLGESLLEAAEELRLRSGQLQTRASHFSEGLRDGGSNSGMSLQDLRSAAPLLTIER